MTQEEKYETKVKEHYPNAKVMRDGAIFFCYDGLKDLGAGFSKNAAWVSAYNKIISHHP